MAFENGELNIVFVPSRDAFLDDVVVVCNRLNDMVEELSRGYPWQCEKLRFVTKSHLERAPLGHTSHPCDDRPYIVSKFSWGLNIDDEWFATWLAVEGSRRIGSGWVVRVEDMDGDFVAAELAEVLPEWVHEEASGSSSRAEEVCRLFFVGGRLHLSPGGACSLTEASDRVRGDDERTRIGEEAERVLWRGRWRGFPERAFSEVQRTLVLVPRKAALMLSRDMGLGGRAAEAFASRDVVEQQRAGRGEVLGIPEDVDRDWFEVGLVLSRIHFAQLSMPLFEPPRRWKDAVEAKQKQVSDPEMVRLGMRVTVGLELVAMRHGLEDVADTDKIPPKLPSDFRPTSTDWLENESTDNTTSQEKIEERIGRDLARETAEKIERELAEKQAHQVVDGVRSFVHGSATEKGVEIHTKTTPSPPTSQQTELDWHRLQTMLKWAKDSTDSFSAPLDTETIHLGIQNAKKYPDGETIDDATSSLRELMQSMDAELVRDSNLKSSFQGDREGILPDSGAAEEAHLVEQLMEAVAGQESHAGPATTLLRGAGVTVPSKWHSKE